MAQEDAVVPEASTAVPELTLDCIRQVTRLCGWRDLLSLCCVSRTWRVAATAPELWRSAFELEFGRWAGAVEPQDWHQAFTQFQHTAQAQHESLCAKFTSALEAIDGFELRLSGSSDDARVPNILPTTVFRTHQSVWMKFRLPNGIQHFGDLHLMARLKHGAPLCVISSPNFAIPTSDMDRMLQSHREGIYAWRDVGEVLPNGERDPAWLVAYVHYEQLLRLWPQPLPQVFPSRLTPTPAASQSDALHLFMEFSSIMDSRCLARLYATSVWRLKRLLVDESVTAALRMLALDNPADEADAADSLRAFASDFLADLESDEVTLSTADQADVPPGQRVHVLQDVLAGECLVDFALMDRGNGLLLGRAGVEIWETTPAADEDPYDELTCQQLREVGITLPRRRAPFYDARFLPDGSDASLRDNLRDNKISLYPGVGELRLTLSCEPHQLRGGSL